MFAKSKLTTSPSSKQVPTHQHSPRHYYPHQRQSTLHTHKYFPSKNNPDSPDYNLTRERLDYRHRNHTENRHNRHSAVTINPRSKSGTSYLKPYSQSIDYSINKKTSLNSEESLRNDKLLMMREERLGKIREGFTMKNRMGAEKKVHKSITANARFNSFTQLVKNQPPQTKSISSGTDSFNNDNKIPKFFDFCESNRYRATAEQPHAQTSLPKSLNRGGGKVRSMKKIAQTPPLIPITISQPISPPMNIQSIMGSYHPFLQIFEQTPSQNFAIRKMQKGVYFGQLKNDLFDGKGIIFYYNGKVFQGHFVEGQKQGLGYESYPDRSSYLGNFCQGKRKGRGRFQWNNGEAYDGQWKSGRKQGSGMWKGQGDISYVGEWHNDTIEGFGVLSQKSTRYEGQFKAFVKCGNGTMRFQHGETYTGSFRHNLPNGQGDYYWPNGDSYQGEFVNGKRHGQGLLRLASGAIYRGEFKNDKRSGCGQESYGDGLHYEGMFENDLKHGWGRLSKGPRQIFEGYWVNNKQMSEKPASFEAIAEEESMYERDPSHASMKKAEGSASMIRQRFMSRKLAKKSLSKERSQESLPQVRPFRRACNCQRHRAANQQIS